MRKWEKLIERAESRGYRVELVEYVESPQSPGILGQALGVCLYAPKLIRIRQALRLRDRCFVLEHELEHAYNDDKPRAWHAEMDRTYHSLPDTVWRHLKMSKYLFPQ